MKYKDESEQGLKDALSAELHINFQSQIAGLVKSIKAMACTRTSTEEICVGRDVILRRVGVFVLKTSSEDVRGQEEGKGEW